jgi:hypothetical protein
MQEKLKQIAKTYEQSKDIIQTEEATKNALIMPFIAALGFNVFNPMEVVPEIVADIGEKKGEKIDYALKSEDKVLMLVECKKIGTPLKAKNVSQVFRYFGALRTKMDVKVAILTNGVEYQFFSDLEHGNILDHSPFFTFNILEFDDQKVLDLQKFSKTQFDADSIQSRAEELKRRAAVETLLDTYMNNPSDSFVRCVLTDIGYEGQKTKEVVATYAVSIKDAFKQVIKDKMELLLKTAMKEGVSEASLETSTDSGDEPKAKSEAETTVEELEGFTIVKAIAREVVSPSRIFLKDTKNYCSVTLDDDVYRYKVIIRFYFNNPSKLKIGLFPDIKTLKTIQKYPINALDDIYQYADQIKATILAYESGAQGLGANTEVETIE